MNSKKKNTKRNTKRRNKRICIRQQERPTQTHQIDDSEVIDNSLATTDSKFHKIVEKLIRKYKPDIEIEIVINRQKNGLMEVIFVKESTIITIVTTNWNEIKRYIDSTLAKDKELNCSICDNDFKKYKRVSCSKCIVEFCGICYINLFRIGQGIITCPFCKYKYGSLMEPHNVIYGVEIIESNFNFDYYALYNNC